MNQSNAICAPPRRKAYFTRKRHFLDGVNDLLEDEGSDWPDKAIKDRRPRMNIKFTFGTMGGPPAGMILQQGHVQSKRQGNKVVLILRYDQTSGTVQVV